MVQVRSSQERAPSTGAPFRFWVRLRLRLRRRRPFLKKETFKDSGSNFKDTESEDGQSADTFNVRRIGGREKKGILCFAHNWALVGTGRWLRLARNRFLLRGDARGNRIGKGKRRESEEEEGKLPTGSDSEVKSCTEGKWAIEKQVGRVKITTWMNGKGGRSIRAPLIGQNCDEDEGKQVVGERKEEYSIEDGCCGCTGGRIWSSREKWRRGIAQIGKSQGPMRHVNSAVCVDNQITLPDDIIEMCLARTPFASLVTARAVCKKWKSLTLSAHFLQLRESICSWEPWLFLFGLSRDGVCLGQIQALDPALSRWHTIKADILTGRLSYSVAAVSSVIYIIGGCCSNSATDSARPEKDSLRTLKTVLMYTPLTGSWRKVCPLTAERAAPIVGVFKARRRTSGGEKTDRGFEKYTRRGQLNRSSEIFSGRGSPARRRIWERGSRHGGELAVYGEVDALGSSANISVMEALEDLKNISQQQNSAKNLEAELSKVEGRGKNRGTKRQRTFGLIVVGGQGTWGEQLDSAEIYDPVTDSWREIASLPADHGTACAGVVCKNFFYVYSDSNKLAAYDLDHEIWHSIRVSEAPARLLDYAPKLVSCRDRVFLLGVAWGMIADSGSEMATRKIWELHQEPTSIGWVKVSQHPDAPLDWNAVYVADDEKIFGVEMFKIFGQMLDFVTICKISGSGAMSWERVSRMEMVMNEMDPSSCLSKTAVVVQL